MNIKIKITITGPRSVGKTTISKILAKKTGYKYFSSDELLNEQLKKINMTLDSAIKEKKIEIINELAEKQVTTILNKKENLIYDFAGGALSVEKDCFGKRMQKLLTNKTIVMGLIPFKEKNNSIERLYERERKRKHFDHLTDEELKNQTKKHYKDVLKEMKKMNIKIVQTKNNSKEKIVEEIIEEIKSIDEKRSKVL